MRKRFDIGEFPEPMKNLPYCCWKYEKPNGRRETKVPYNPKTGERAKADTLSTFGTLEEAIVAYNKNRSYFGIGMDVHMGGTVGCIDIDACFDDDGVMSERAKTAVEMLPDAHVEYSPSKTGLHLFFVLPEGFVFDSDLYYTNSRKKKMEIYLPCATNHFMTVTGDVYHTGGMIVSAEELQTFLDTFMQRPTMKLAKIDPPECGSILTDAEVLQKLAYDPGGERFMKMYRGEWEECKPEHYTEEDDWSQSEADLALCRKLAFYCRGDLAQMDRLFRESGLMREKWDKVIGGTTYAMITLTNAVSGCGAFYDPPPQVPLEVFLDDYAALIDELLESPLTIDAVLSEKALMAAAWAMGNDSARYYKLRAALPRGIGVKNYEREVKQRFRLLHRENEESEPEIKPHRLKLEGVSTPGMIVPKGYVVNERGVFSGYDEEDVHACISPEPLFISGKIVDVDYRTEKLEMTFRRNGEYKSLIAPRADMLNKNAIIQYANTGLFVSSSTAGYVTAYIADLEAANNYAIPVIRCIRRAGWVGNKEFFPYCLASPMKGLEDDENSEKFLEHMHTEGEKDIWLKTAAKVRTMPLARTMLAASFASPLLLPLQHRNIFYHSWCDTKSGKTAALKFAMSVWGDPAALMKSYFSTMVGMEHRAGTMKHLPLALDELQTIEKKLDINNMVYTLGNGVGKTRGKAGGGIRAMYDWRNCIISTGEQPISTENSMDGINTRLLEVYGKPVPNEALAREMYQVSERNYGFAAEPYIRFVMDHLNDLKADFESMQSALDMLYGDGNVSAENIAVLSMADYYSSICLFGIEKEAAWNEAIEMGAVLMNVLRQEDHTDTVDRAWNFVTGWVAGNKKKFTEGLYEPSEVYGFVENGKVSVICGALNTALEEAGYSYRKCIRGFGERGYLRMNTDSDGRKRSQVLKRVKGIPTRVYMLNLEIGDADEEDERAFP